MDPILNRRAIYRCLRDQDLTKTRFSPISSVKEGLYLKKKVLLGYTDISAAGSRALLCMSLKKEHCDLDIPELKSCDVMCRPTSKEIDISLLPLQIIHCKYEEFSLVVINTALPSNKCHLVADKIIQLCIECNVERLVILTALKLAIPDKKISPIYENTFNTRALTDKPVLPNSTKVNDGLLNVLIQMVQLENIPCNILIAPGHSAFTSVPSYDDSSLQAIQAFHDFISSWTRLKFDEVICRSLYEPTLGNYISLYSSDTRRNMEDPRRFTDLVQRYIVNHLIQVTDML